MSRRILAARLADDPGVQRFAAESLPADLGSRLVIPTNAVPSAEAARAAGWRSARTTPAADSPLRPGMYLRIPS